MLRQTSFPTQGRFHVRRASCADDVAAARALRQRGFALTAPDADIYDDICVHMLVEDSQTGALVCCFRLGVLNAVADMDRSYCAQYYDFTFLFDADGPLVEMGRFCVEPGLRDADILRVAWGALTGFVDDVGAISTVANVLAKAAETVRTAGRGPVQFCLMDPGLPGEVEIDSGQEYPVTPQIKGAIKSLNGVLEVEDI